MVSEELLIIGLFLTLKKIGNSWWKKKKSNTGDQQGYILGPLIYVHGIDTNISKDLSIKLTLFADDTSILINGKDTQDLIFSLDRISGNILPWFDKNRLIINKGKSLALCFHHKSNKHIVFPDIILKDKQVTYIFEIKFSRAWLDHNINWDCHIENLIVK